MKSFNQPKHCKLCPNTGMFTLIFIITLSFITYGQNEQAYLIKKEGVLFFDSTNTVQAEYHYYDRLFKKGDFRIENNTVFKGDENLISFEGRKISLEGKEYVFRGDFFSFKKAKLIEKNSGKVMLEIRKSKSLTVDKIEVIEITSFHLNENSNEILNIWLLYQEGKWLKNKSESKEAWAMGVGVGVMSSAYSASVN